MTLYCVSCLKTMEQVEDGVRHCVACEVALAVEPEEIPTSWDPERMVREDMTIMSPLITWISIHGVVAMAFTHPQMPLNVMDFLAAFLEGMEHKLVSIGLEVPPSEWRTYWHARMKEEVDRDQQ